MFSKTFLLTEKLMEQKRDARSGLYLSLVPESCVVPSWYRMSMVESEERPFRRPNSRGLFKSVQNKHTVQTYTQKDYTHNVLIKNRDYPDCTGLSLGLACD